MVAHFLLTIVGGFEVPLPLKTVFIYFLLRQLRSRRWQKRSQQVSDVAPVLSNYHYELSVTNRWKTECVAQLSRKLLFQLTCGLCLPKPWAQSFQVLTFFALGDLGTIAKEVEGSFEINFELANGWGCIVLIGEAVCHCQSRKSSNSYENFPAQ